jgi:hypothetical protein
MRLISGQLGVSFAARSRDLTGPERHRRFPGDPMHLSGVSVIAASLETS